MALFTLADLHLSLSGDKPMDVFGGAWCGFESRLTEYWSYMVRPEDTVVIPGDISWAMDLSGVKEDLAFIQALPGEKILMRGNHDYWWPSRAKLEAFLEENGFSSIRFIQNDAILTQGKIVCGSRGWMCEDKMTAADEKILAREALRFRFSLTQAKAIREEQMQKGDSPEIVVFSHYPVVTAAMRENPILEVLKEFDVKRVYYGHLHNWQNKPVWDEYEGISFTLVSSDYRNFTPVRID